MNECISYEMLLNRSNLTYKKRFKNSLDLVNTNGKQRLKLKFKRLHYNNMRWIAFLFSWYIFVYISLCIIYNYIIYNLYMLK